MKATHVCRVVVHLDLFAVDKADAYETLHAWADAVSSGDAEGVRILQECQVLRSRPTYGLADICELQKPPADPAGLTFDFLNEKIKAEINAG